MLGQRYFGKTVHDMVQFLFKQPGFAGKITSCLVLEGAVELLSGETVLTTEHEIQQSRVAGNP